MSVLGIAIRAATIAIVAASNAGCKPDCEVGSSYCQEGQSFSCQCLTAGESGCEDARYQLSQTCEGSTPVCVEVEQNTAAGVASFCAMSSEPDPLCVPTREGNCDGENQIVCNLGYRVQEVSCGSPELCVIYRGEDRSSAFCALSPEPDPCCDTSSGLSNYCSPQGDEIECKFTYAVEVIEGSPACASCADGGCSYSCEP